MPLCFSCCFCWLRPRSCTEALPYFNAPTPIPFGCVDRPQPCWFSGSLCCANRTDWRSPLLFASGEGRKLSVSILPILTLVEWVGLDLFVRFPAGQENQNRTNTELFSQIAVKSQRIEFGLECPIEVLTNRDCGQPVG